MTRRTKSEVLAARQNAAAGGCCDRFADYIGCDCLEMAADDVEHVEHDTPFPICPWCQAQYPYYAEPEWQRTLECYKCHREFTVHRVILYTTERVGGRGY